MHGAARRRVGQILAGTPAYGTAPNRFGHGVASTQFRHGPTPIARRGTHQSWVSPRSDGERHLLALPVGLLAVLAGTLLP